MNYQKWWEALIRRGAVWKHSGDMKAPHVVKADGTHTSGYINAGAALSQVDFLRMAAANLAQQLHGLEGVNWVMGSAMSSITFATAVALELGARHVGFTEKAPAGGFICRWDIKPGSRVLQIEEESSTGMTPQQSINAILAKNPGALVVPLVGALVIRCSRKSAILTAGEFIPLVELPAIGVLFKDFGKKTDKCQLCVQGSRAVTNPKRVWADLMETTQDPTHTVVGAEYA